MSNLLFRLAVSGLFASALGLAGCGQKGPLILPPEKAAEKRQKQAERGQLPDERIPQQPNRF